MADIAFAAGFASIRQFNDTITEVYGLTPTRIREASDTRTRTNSGHQAGVITVQLAHRAPIDIEGLTGWFHDRVITGMESVTASTYTRALRIGQPGGAANGAIAEISYRPPALSARLWLDTLSDLPRVLAMVRRLFDLDADPLAVDATLAADRRLEPRVAATPGIRIPGTVNAAEILTRAILGQQVTVASARRQLDRLVAELGEPLPDSFSGPAGYRLFPRAEAIAEHAPALVRGPRRRTQTLQLACAAIAEGRLQMDVSRTRAELTRELTALPGIGPWTADYIALRFLGHPDVLVSGDVAVRRGARHLGFADDALFAQTRSMSPWRSYLSMHLWRASAQPKAELEATTTPAGPSTTNHWEDPR